MHGNVFGRSQVPTRWLPLQVHGTKSAFVSQLQSCSQRVQSTKEEDFLVSGDLT